VPVLVKPADPDGINRKESRENNSALLPGKAEFHLDFYDSISGYCRNKFYRARQVSEASIAQREASFCRSIAINFDQG